MCAAVRWVVLGLLLGGVGCGAQVPQPAGEVALTLPEWRMLPPDTRFAIDTLERLKQGEPRLQNDREWNVFLRQELLPAKKRQLAVGKP